MIACGVMIWCNYFVFDCVFLVICVYRRVFGCYFSLFVCYGWSDLVVFVLCDWLHFVVCVVSVVLLLMFDFVCLCLFYC